MPRRPETMAISTFKATCLAVLERVRRTGRSVLVTRRGEPVAEVIPPPQRAPGPVWLGSFTDQIRITGDVVGPVADPEDWDALRR